MVAKKIVPLLVIVGETASGKSELALQLAQLFNGEIICADAWTLRRQADVGTAKPTKSEQDIVAHHLIDVIDPNEPFNASDYKKLALQAIDSIGKKGRLPIMVGGTGLYLDGVIYNYSFLASQDEELREKLNDMEIPALLDMAQKEGLDTSSLDTSNKRRLIRLIETKGVKPTKGELRDNTLIIGLRTDKQALKERIIRRTDAMLSLGLEKEVFELSRRYGWGCEALQGTGYKEWQEYYLGNISKAEVRDRIIKNTMDLAKRQRTWFKRNKSIQWITTPVNLADAVDLITTKLLS